MRFVWNRSHAEMDEPDRLGELLSGARPEPQDLAPDRAQVLFDRALIASLRVRRRPAFRRPILCAAACGLIGVCFLGGRALWSLGRPHELPQNGAPIASTASPPQPQEQHVVAQKRDLRRTEAAAKDERVAVRRSLNTHPRYRVASLGGSGAAFTRSVRSSAGIEKPDDAVGKRHHQPAIAEATQSGRPDFALSVRDAPQTTPGFAEVSTTPVGDNLHSRTTCKIEQSGLNSTRLTISRTEVASSPAVLVVETTSMDVGGTNLDEGTDP